jgi:uncharacterized Tic20 family protein
MDDAQRETQTRQWAFFLHLSLLAGCIVPFAGLIAPIVIWQIKKTEFPGIDIHGKIVVNWIISACIYSIGGAILTIILIGIPILIALGIVTVIFAIIGGIKANNGEVWPYPLTIKFIK